MCGIAGIWGPSLQNDEAEQIVGRMTYAIRHRGPDDEGVWSDGERGVALGHQRLSILDLTPSGHQPMASRDGRYVIVYNGEIYNFRELRDLLTTEGETFRGRSDTEVILAAISRWGLQEAVNRFVGMFAFVMWDRQEHQIHLVRDRFGEKPLYYGWMGKTLLFGSELKALQAHPAWVGTVDRDALTLYLRYGCIPAPHTIYKDVYKVRPAAIVTISPGGKFRSVHYWSLEDVIRNGLDNPIQGPESEILDELEQELKRAIGQQMVADVPIGAFLSGGIDSSVVVALMQAQASQPVRTFTIGFESVDYNEAIYAKVLARYMGTEHTELYVSPSEARAVIPQLPSIYDEPFADSSQIPTFLVAQLARRDVTVALSGDGGDELFGGYNRYFLGSRIWKQLAPVPRFIRRAAAGAALSVPPAWWGRALGLIPALVPEAIRIPRAGERIHKLARAAGAATATEYYERLISFWPDPSQVVIGGEDVSTISKAGQGLVDSIPTIEEMMYHDTARYLPSDIMTKVDRATMAVSLESRAPFLDHRVVELGWKVPMGMKLRHGIGKVALRKVLFRHVPEKLLDRPKMGFGVPIGAWLRGPLSEWAGDLLSESRIRSAGYFDAPTITKAWKEHRAGTRNWRSRCGAR